MKKVIGLIICFLMMSSLISCVNTEGSTEASTEENTPVTVDEKLLDVTITMDASLFTDSTPEEIEASAKENGIKKCVVNEDGSVTYTMSKLKHRELLKEMKTGIDESCSELVNGGNKVESFLEIKVNDDCSKFDVFVDPDKYSDWDAINVLAFYVQGAYYQGFAGVEYSEIDIIVNFINNSTKEVIDTSSYRDYVNNLNSSQE